MGNTQVSKTDNNSVVNNYGSNNAASIGGTSGGAQNATNVPTISTDLRNGNPLCYAYSGDGSLLYQSDALCYVVPRKIVDNYWEVLKLEESVKPITCKGDEITKNLTDFGLTYGLCAPGTSSAMALKAGNSYNWYGPYVAIRKMAIHYRSLYTTYQNARQQITETLSIVHTEYPSSQIGTAIEFSLDHPEVFFQDVDYIENNPEGMMVELGKLINGIEVTKQDMKGNVIVTQDDPPAMESLDAWSTNLISWPGKCDFADISNATEYREAKNTSAVGVPSTLMIDTSQNLYDLDLPLDEGVKTKTMRPSDMFYLPANVNGMFSTSSAHNGTIFHLLIHDPSATATNPLHMLVT